MKDKSIRVLLVEDNPGDARLIRETLTEVSGVQFHLEWVDRLSTGLERLAEGGIDAVLLDLSLPDSQGIDTFIKVYTQAPQVPIILMTGLDDESLAVRAVREGAQDYLVKGQVDGNLLIRAIRYAIERKQTEGALRESERKYKELADLLPQYVFEADVKFNFTFINRYGLDSAGYTQEDIDGGLNALQMFIPEERDRVVENMLRILNGEKLAGVEYTAQRKDGSTYPVTIYAAPITRDDRPVGLRGIAIDITDRKRMEEELLKIQKLESIGILAGGIAHDLNNLLTGVIGNISLARMYEEPADKDKRLIEAERASMRIKDLTQQLLTFSRGGAPTLQVTTIGDILQDSATFVLRGSNIRCEFSIPVELWPVNVDEGQISQIINNLVINADQAMASGGTVKMTAENVVIRAEHGLPLKDGGYVKISIQDHGIGIPEADLPKIFDPFFTTKQQGNGLGLATCYSIIQKHNGHIAVDSQLGVGTAFHIYLPAFPEEIVKEKDEARVEAIIGEGGVLVMDDEQHIRDLVSDMLQRIGYEVTTATDGAEAIELYKEAMESGNPFDAVIMDLTIPGGVGGREAIQRLVEIDPEVKAVVSSGYSNDPVLASPAEYGFRGVIAKPYETREVHEILHRVIASVD